MEHHAQNNGFETFLEHWSLLVVVVVALATTEVLDFFTGLSGSPWIWLLIVSFALMFSGGGLIGYAKSPAYRSGRLFTFGVKSVPQRFVGFCRWGWRLFVFGAALGFCLLLSRHDRG